MEQWHRIITKNFVKQLFVNTVFTVYSNYRLQESTAFRNLQSSKTNANTM